MITKSFSSQPVRRGINVGKVCYAANTPFSVLKARFGSVEPLLHQHTLGETFGTITYENSGGRRMNFCDHSKTFFKENAKGLPFAICTNLAKETCSTGRVQFAYVSGYIGFDRSDLLTLMYPRPSQYRPTNAERALAWAELKPQLNDGFSLLNFIYELRELPQLIGLAKSLRRLFTNASLWKQSGNLSEVLLGYSFGVAPLVSDIQKLFNLGIEVQKRINEFRDKGKKVLPYHHRRLISSEEKYVPTQVGALKFTAQVWYWATLWASYIYDTVGELEGIVKYYGLDLTLGKVWQALPWSFVVDWVLKVGDFLDALDSDPSMKLKVSGYCDTVKMSTKVVSLVDSAKRLPTFISTVAPPTSNFQCDKGDGYEIWSFENSRYLRTPGEPYTGFAFPVSDTLSARELVLGGALLRTSIRG